MPRLDPTEHSYLRRVQHRRDALKHTGYEYRGKLLSKFVSPYLWEGNPRRQRLLAQLQRLLEHGIERAKDVKRFVSFAQRKDDPNVS